MAVANPDLGRELEIVAAAQKLNSSFFPKKFVSCDCEPKYEHLALRATQFVYLFNGQKYQRANGVEEPFLKGREAFMLFTL